MGEKRKRNCFNPIKKQYYFNPIKKQYYFKPIKKKCKIYKDNYIEDIINKFNLINLND